jgi:citrate lyase subunit beta/citryl-CoA lyase
MWGPILSIARPNRVVLAGCDKARQKGRMNRTPHHHPLRLRRSVLSVPAAHPRALAKSAALDCDAIIFDLEDSVLPEKKAEARAALVAHFEALDRASGCEHVIRINSLDGPDGALDLEAVLDCMPDAVLLPKVSEPQDVLTVADWLSEAGADDGPRLWAMIETAAGLLNLAAIAETGRTQGGRLDCFVVGLNDLRKETGIADIPGRPFLVPLLLQVVVAARASGLDIVDAVFNDFSDTDGLDAECRQGSQMGFDGKMLIHPAQIAIANEAFGVSEGAAAEALAIVAAFAAPENAGKAVIDLRGRMVEKLHADQAGRLLAKVDLINERKRNA